MPPERKELTQEQKEFLSKFLVKGTRKEERKLTKQYQDFLGRKTKILTEVYKLPANDPTRKALEREINKIDEGKEEDGTLDLKGAYDKLEDVKVRARRAARGLPPLTAADVERRIQQLARSGFGRASQSKEVLDKMEALCA